MCPWRLVYCAAGDPGHVQFKSQQERMRCLPQLTQNLCSWFQLSVALPIARDQNRMTTALIIVAGPIESNWKNTSWPKGGGHASDGVRNAGICRSSGKRCDQGCNRKRSREGPCCAHCGHHDFDLRLPPSRLCMIEAIYGVVWTLPTSHPVGNE